jgi:integrase
MAVRERPKKGSGHWHFDFRIRGVRYRGSIPEARLRSEALSAEAKIRSQVFEGKYEAAAMPVTFSKFLDEAYRDFCKAHVKAWGQMMGCLKPARKFFAGKHLHEITPFLVEKYKVERIRTPTWRGTARKANTVNHELTALSHALGLAVRSGLLKANPCASVKRLKWERRERYLKREEEGALRMALRDLPDAWIADATLLALNTGMRQAEILRLEWGRVDFSRGVIKVTGTKTCAAREVPLNEEARRILDGRRSESPYVFAERGRLPHRATLDRHFRAVVKKAGIVDFHYHDLRHTVATRMLDAGIRESVIARVLGHSSVAMTVTYAHVTDELTRAAIESVSGKDGHKLVTGDFSSERKRA